VTLEDAIIRRGLDYQLTQPVSLPVVPGQNFVGKIVAMGKNLSTTTTTTPFQLGDRVGGLLQYGGNARFVEVSQHSLVPIPKKVDPADAVCIVSVYAAASQVLCMATNKDTLDAAIVALQGKNILVIGGLDGLAQAIIQLCRRAKAVKVSVPAPDRRHAYIRSVLKATPLPEDSKEWGPRVASSMDYVFDGICDGSMDPSLRALREEGKCICVGNAALLGEHMGWFGVR
jgi:NADPH:quinone reductase-like Zn-dependent oxidoreductase